MISGELTRRVGRELEEREDRSSPGRRRCRRPSTSVMDALNAPVRAARNCRSKAIVARPAARAAACTLIRFQSSSRAITAPTHAPAATPRVSGAARGLEKMTERGAGNRQAPADQDRHDDARRSQVKHD